MYRSTRTLVKSQTDVTRRKEENINAFQHQAWNENVNSNVFYCLGQVYLLYNVVSLVKVAFISVRELVTDTINLISV
jgi:hypothetical protein